ncbi:MAG TPA: hypothetical protein PLU72_00675 [Candidatus Ozemobacteraceae bacterium]|nr:hypothetical protein [Candidatus Ozemobacteraceae bacterium]
MSPEPRAASAAPASPADKITATLTLGIGSNFSTMAGVLAAWIFLTRTGWVDGFWRQLFHAFLLAPVFLGDAMNAYVLGRIDLDTRRGWDDVQITEEGRRALSRLRLPWRALSIATATSLAAIFLVARAPEPAAYAWVRYVFPALLFIHAARCLYTIRTYIAPRLPSYGGAALFKRAVWAYLAGALWLGWLLTRPHAPFAWWSVPLHGCAFFLISGWLQPLPSKFSVFHPAGSGRKLPKLVVEPLRAGVVQPAISGDVRGEEARWQSEHGFVTISDVRMPLLEMPLFEAAGTALAAPDNTALLLILQSEVRPRPHCTLISWVDGKAFVTTNFGSTTSRFPAGITYLSRNPGEAPASFLAAHRAACPGGAGTAIPQPPWQALQAMVEAMVVFLHREIQVPAAGASAGTPDRGSGAGDGTPAQTTNAEVIDS